MTPTQHKAEAEALLTAATDTSGKKLGPSDSDFAVIAAHAALAQATGTGTHYTAAEAALTQAAAGKSSLHGLVTYLEASRVALAHAQLADR